MTLSQKKIIIISFLVVFVFLFFWVFVYQPSKNTVAKIKSELLDTEVQIEDIEAISATAKTIDAAVELLKNRYEDLVKKFPAKEEEAIKMLSDFAVKFNMDIVSITPQAKAEVLGQDNQALSLNEKVVYKVPVALEMRCSYKDLIGYIWHLKQFLPSFVAVEQLNINKDSADVNKLKVDMNINLYLLF